MIANHGRGLILQTMQDMEKHMEFHFGNKIDPYKTKITKKTILLIALHIADLEYVKKKRKCPIIRKCLICELNSGNASSVILKEINTNGSKPLGIFLRCADIQQGLQIIDGIPLLQKDINGKEIQYPQDIKG